MSNSDLRVVQVGRFRWSWDVRVDSRRGWATYEGTALTQSGAMRKARRQILWALHSYHERKRPGLDGPL